jgi:predicted RNase H-like HicB family nuclease
MIGNKSDKARKGSMKSEYTAVIKEVEGWWIGWIEEIPGVNCQEKSREELVDSLREALKEALEFNRNDALTAAGGDFLEETIAI